MNKFSLTLHQLERLINKAKSDDNMEDILTFKLDNNRLVVTQNDWGHENTNILMDKPN